MKKIFFILFCCILVHANSYASYEVLREARSGKTLYFVLRLSMSYPDYLKTLTDKNMMKVLQVLPKVEKVNLLSSEMLQNDATKILSQEHFVQFKDRGDQLLSNVIFKVQENGLCQQLDTPEKCSQVYNLILNGPVASSVDSSLFPGTPSASVIIPDSFQIKMNLVPEKDAEQKDTNKALVQFTFSIENNDYRDFFAALVKKGQVREVPSESTVFDMAKVLSVKFFDALF